MIPVTQTKVVIKNKAGDIVVNGNCYAAAIASMLDLPITEVPNGEVFFDDQEDYYFFRTLMHRFLKNKGLQLVSDWRFAAFHSEDHFSEDQNIEYRELLKDTFYLATGESARGFAHICIYMNGQLCHDPHPSKDGLETVYDWQVINKLEAL